MDGLDPKDKTLLVVG